MTTLIVKHVWCVFEEIISEGKPSRPSSPTSGLVEFCSFCLTMAQAMLKVLARVLLETIIEMAVTFYAIGRRERESHRRKKT